MQNRKKTFRRSSRIVAIVVLAAVLCGLLVGWCTAKQRIAEEEQQGQSQQQAPVPTPTPTPTPEPIEIPIDFATLQQENPDAYGWISVSGTKVDYPLMQHATETDYYLNHTFEGEKKLPGAIYTRNDTAQDFSDPCTVVYGHNMKDDSMFGSLHDYESSTFFENESNRTITTYTPSSIQTWQIFAAVEYSDVLLSAAYDFSDPAQLQAFVDSLKSCRGSFDSQVPVDGSSRILVLSTCVTGDRDHLRYLVVGVLTDEQVQAS